MDSYTEASLASQRLLQILGTKFKWLEGCPSVIRLQIMLSVKSVMGQHSEPGHTSLNQNFQCLYVHDTVAFVTGDRFKQCE